MQSCRTNSFPVGRRTCLATASTTAAAGVACKVAADLCLQRGGPTLGTLQIRTERIHRLSKNVVLKDDGLCERDERQDADG